MKIASKEMKILALVLVFIISVSVAKAQVLSYLSARNFTKIRLIEQKLKTMTKYHFLKLISLSSVLAFAACTETVTITNSSYTGTGSVTQGAGTTTTVNLFPSGVRVAALG
jgi:hypothetical protein